MWRHCVWELHASHFSSREVREQQSGAFGGAIPTAEVFFDVVENQLNKFDWRSHPLQVVVDWEFARWSLRLHFLDDLRFPHSSLSAKNDALTVEDTPQPINQFIAPKNFVRGQLPTRICLHAGNNTHNLTYVNRNVRQK